MAGPETRCDYSPRACARTKRRSPRTWSSSGERPVFGLLAALGPRSAAAPRASTRSWSRRCARATSCTTAAAPARGHDADLALLAGDYLYALGIDRLAALGDTEAVAVLAELIGRCAQLHAEGRDDEVPALWRSAALAVGGRDHDRPRGGVSQ